MVHDAKSMAPAEELRAPHCRPPICCSCNGVIRLVWEEGMSRIAEVLAVTHELQL